MANQKKPEQVQGEQEQGRRSPLSAMHDTGVEPAAPLGGLTSPDDDVKQRGMDVQRDKTPAVPQAPGPESQQLPTGEYRYGEWLGRPVKELPTPPEVLKAFDRELGEMQDQGRPVVGAFKERLLEEYKLQFYFGGQPIAYRETDAGKTVLAVGYGHIGDLRRQLNGEENEAVTTGFAETW